MCKLCLLLLLVLPFLSDGQMIVYTVAGNDTATSIGDGRLATAASINSTEGIWADGNCNLYISHGQQKIRKINSSTGVISTIAGKDDFGYSGDGGPATDALISTYGLYADAAGNVYTAESANVIRRIDGFSGIITTYAGGGIILGDGGLATNAQLNKPSNVYGDKAGNIYIGERGRIRMINTAGIITTIAGTGITGLSGDGGPATTAQIFNPHGMLLDNNGNFYFADRSNNRIRKIDPSGIITTYAGTTDGFSGDGGPATAAQLSGPISFVIDYTGSMVIGDNQNNCLRRVNGITGIITTIAGVHGGGSLANGIPATTAEIHPEFMYLDRKGNIYYTCYCDLVRKVTNYLPCLPNNGNNCGETAVQEVATHNDEVMLYPNPAGDELHIKYANGIYSKLTITNNIGQTITQQTMTAAEMNVPVSSLPAGVYYLRVAGTDGVVVKKFVK
ncbi:MAG: hypothetical protein JWQ38_2380 [Flavipsychrobacter sp.]|nr:hypothetical protein [Flavipsychrobacter sp.]